jgi:uncharacterized short protein YbdD (DUF466 family)
MATATVQRVAGVAPNKSASDDHMMRWHRAQRLVRRLWRGVRDWCGDSAYERYLIAVRRRNSAPCQALTEEQFYVEQLNRRYSRPNRCC